MGLADLANLGEAVGGFAVVLSLLYLTYELRTSTKALKASTASQASQSWAALNESVIHDPELLALIVKFNSEDFQPSNFSKEELYRSALFCRVLMQKFESEYFLYESGILAENIWNIRVSYFHRSFELPGWKWWWEKEKKISAYTDEFLQNVFLSAE